ncbi:DUF1269 domain-containing protein [Rhodococcus triatomae]|nr:DUF6325 family protein [Rhodococcus triatomae]QNG18569.1 DUF1269 domain-containing protein [Rhodococcus triatomae]QNG21762.1 DUF1269 domain-containing protein [Rhodococcus triatomae]
MGEPHDISPLEIGPVELVVLSFPGTVIDAGTVAALRDVVDHGYVTVLDLVYLTRGEDGTVVEIDVDEDLGEVGLADLQIAAQDLVSDVDLEIVRETLAPGNSAVVVVYEETWARRFAVAAREASGEVVLHVQIPHESVLAALRAAQEEAASE